MAWPRMHAIYVRVPPAESSSAELGTHPRVRAEEGYRVLLTRLLASDDPMLKGEAEEDSSRQRQRNSSLRQALALRERKQINHRIR
jgi:hypothetical protein